MQGMNTGRELTFGVAFRKRKTQSGERHREPLGAIPRISRLMALAIRFEELVSRGEVGNYAELARLGGVSRTRMMQIMQLVNLAPDIQEQLLFMNSPRLSERRLRPVVRHMDWGRQRAIFGRLAESPARESPTQQPKAGHE